VTTVSCRSRVVAGSGHASASALSSCRVSCSQRTRRRPRVPAVPVPKGTPRFTNSGSTAATSNPSHGWSLQPGNTSPSMTGPMPTTAPSTASRGVCGTVRADTRPIHPGLNRGWWIARRLPLIRNTLTEWIVVTSCPADSNACRTDRPRSWLRSLRRCSALAVAIHGYSLPSTSIWTITTRTSVARPAAAGGAAESTTCSASASTRPVSATAAPGCRRRKGLS
jgi:hypothetical protein